MVGAARNAAWVACLPCWLVLWGCAGAPAVTLADLAGRRHAPLEVAPQQVHVIVFLSQECPIANAYAPTLARLAEDWRDQPVRVFLVHVDPELSVAEARRHRDDYGLPGVVLRDPRHELARRLGITHTPEAVVLSDRGLVYRGRIDDRWPALGVRRPKASVHDLHDAVATALRGEVVPGPYPEPTGCLLPEPAPRGR
ncbi:MAG TPA: redoxin domain-containing protein [bacterium]|nr:redoxin domain-containing protein [bacterium]